MHQARFLSIGTQPRSGASAGASLAFALCSMLSLMAPAPAASAPADPSGLWSTKDDESIIEIAPCGEFYCGTLVWLKEPNESDGRPKADTKNEDESKRDRPLVGIVLLADLAPEKNQWRGKAYNADDGKTYEITFKPGPSKAPGEKAEIRGCVLKVFCQSEIFTRVQALPTGASSPPASESAKPKPAAKNPAPRP